MFILTMTSVSQWHWNPLEYLDGSICQHKYAVIVLNRPINVKRDVMISLWNRALVRITVDGGTKSWQQFLLDEGFLAETVENASPHIICGDLDSLPECVMGCFPEALVVRTPDQDETDFTKSLRVLDAYLLEKDVKIDAVIVVCDSSGRFDQIVANVNTLYKAADILGDTAVFLLAENSLTWLLRSGTHVIHVSECLREKRPWCSLVPVGQPVRCVTTTGLKWNLDHRQLEFGKLVSTSNKLSGDPCVTVQTDTALVWSMGLGYTVD